MERLEFVGADAEGRLVFVRRGAEESERFEVEPTPELAAEAARLATPREDPQREPRHVRVLPSAVAERRHGGLAPGAFERATGFGMGLPEPRGVRALIGGAAAATPLEREEPEQAERQETLPAERRLEEHADPAAGDDHGAAPEGASAPRLFSVPEPAEVGPEGVVVRRPRLSTGEIQALLRSGRSPRSVAEQAGAPIDWVKRLDETISRERLLAVSQMLHVPMTRPHQGIADVPVGEAVLLNLRARKVSTPERALEQGWSASRPPRGEWRVRLALEHRGDTMRADWSYDPRARRVLPLNALASELGWPPVSD